MPVLSRMASRPIYDLPTCGPGGGLLISLEVIPDE